MSNMSNAHTGAVDTQIKDTVSSRAIEKLKRDMGLVMLNALNDPLTVELICNSDGKLWQEKLGVFTALIVF